MFTRSEPGPTSSYPLPFSSAKVRQQHFE